MEEVMKNEDDREVRVILIDRCFYRLNAGEENDYYYGCLEDKE